MNFGGDLEGNGSTIQVRDFIVRDDHIACNFCLHEPGYKTYVIEGRAPEHTQGKFKGQYAGVAEYDYDGEKHYPLFVFELEHAGMMSVYGEWHEYNELFEFGGDLEPMEVPKL